MFVFPAVLYVDKVLRLLPLLPSLFPSHSLCYVSESLVRVEALEELDSASLTADWARTLREIMELLNSAG